MTPSHVRSSRRFRRRLTAAFVLVAAVSAGLVAVITYVLAREYRYRNVRSAAIEETRFALAVAPLDLEPASFERFIEIYQSRSDAHIVAVRGDESLSSSDLERADIPAGLDDLTSDPAVTEAAVAGRPMLVAGAVGRDGVQYYLFFSLDQVHDSLDELARAALLSWLGTLVLAAAVGSVIARRTLRPVARTAQVAEAIAGGDFDARLPDHAGDEFGTLAASFNHMADEVQRLIHQLNDAAERERTFTADVAHELRTPLTGMSASAALLQGHLDELPDSSRQPAEILIYDAQRLRGLVTELLELAELDAATGEPDLAELHLRAAISTVIADADERRSAPIVVDVPAGLAVRAEPVALRRILSNLIDNAVRHGGGAVLIRARLEPDEARLVVVDVVDDGPGIGEFELTRIFERFHKADRSRASSGSGLGLAIAQQHAVRCGGDLSAHNEPGHGARFELRLPAADAGRDVVSAPAEAADPPPESMTAAP